MNPLGDTVFALPAFRAGAPRDQRFTLEGANGDKSELIPRRHGASGSALSGGMGGNRAPELFAAQFSIWGDNWFSADGVIPLVCSLAGFAPVVQLPQQRSQTVSITGFHTFFLMVLSWRTNTLTDFRQQSDGDPQTILWCNRPCL